MLKQKGWIRSYGMSTKTVEGGLETIQYSDMAMVSYNPINTENKKVIDQALQFKKGILIKKALASGHISKLSGEHPIEHTMKMIFAHQGVTSVISGTLNPIHLQENCDAVIKAISLK